MSDKVIKVKNLSKRYTIGDVHTDLLSERIGQRFKYLLNKIRPKKDLSPLTYNLSQEKNFWALKDVSFEIEQGEVVGIIGRNGAGKTTLLKILSRITEPTEGMAEIYGRVGSLLEVGTGFHPELSGRENIYLNGLILGMSRAEVKKKFDEIVAFAEVEKFLDTPVKRYSSGMYVRLAFAVAAHLEPEILVIDEVLAVGDSQFQEKCLGKMDDVSKREGRTVLFVSHNMMAIQNLCKSCIMLSSGRIKQVDTADKVISSYLSDSIHNKFLPENAQRVGNMPWIIRDFSIDPKTPRTGQHIIFRITLSLSESQKSIEDVEVAMGFTSVMGFGVMHLSSRSAGIKGLTINNGTMIINVELLFLPLTPGDYTISLWVGRGNQPIDWLQKCFMMQVETGSIVQGGELIDTKGYPITMPAVWTVEQQ